MEKCDEKKKWTQFYSSYTPIRAYKSKDDETYELLRKFNGNLRDINLKGRLDLCGPICTDDNTPCNVNKEQGYNPYSQSVDCLSIN